MYRILVGVFTPKKPLPRYSRVTTHMIALLAQSLSTTTTNVVYSQATTSNPQIMLSMLDWRCLELGYSHRQRCILSRNHIIIIANSCSQGGPNMANFGYNPCQRLMLSSTHFAISLHVLKQPLNIHKHALKQPLHNHKPCSETPTTKSQIMLSRWLDRRWLDPSYEPQAGLWQPLHNPRATICTISISPPS